MKGPSSLSTATPTLVSAAATLAVSIIGPVAAFNAMHGSIDPRVSSALSDRTAVGVMDLYMQLLTVYSALFALLATAGTVYVANDSSWARRISTSIGLLAFLWFAWLFTMGGASATPLDPYVPAGPWRPGDLRWPPLDSLLTMTRGAVVVLSAGLAVVGLTSRKGL